MRRRVRREPPYRLLELALGTDAVAAPRLVPRNRDVHESLEEVTLVRRRRAPLVFQLLVRREVLAAADQRDTGFKP